MTYKELKDVIKVGDEVRAIKGKDNPCAQLKNDGSDTQRITQVNGYGFRINGCYHSYTEYGYLEIVSKKYHCPYCKKEKSSSFSVICPCEVAPKYNADYEDWKNK